MASYISDHETQNDNSDYCRFRKRQVKELSKILAKEMIARANKKAMQLLSSRDPEVHEIPKAHRENATPRANHKNASMDLLEDFDLSWVSKSERFKNFNRQKQVLTINRRTEYEIEDFRRQERERYKEPQKSAEYYQGKFKYVVGPCIRKRAQMRSAPIHHVLLKTERPPFVSILSIVRDAVARLPDGIGTRTDVVELCKES